MSKLAEKAILPLLDNVFAIKSVKTDVGHDLAGATGTVYMHGKKAFIFNDDGCGGEIDIIFTNNAMEDAVKGFVKNNNIAQVMWDNGWNFLDSIDKISVHQATVMIGEALIYQSTLNSELKKIQRKTKGKFIVGTELSYREIGFKGIKDLADMMKYKNGLELLQSAYDDLKKEMREGERIFNTDEQLDALGIKR